jgi:hypothetical protein
MQLKMLFICDFFAFIFEYNLDFILEKKFL